MAAKRDRATQALLTKVADQVGDVVLELADIFDVAAMTAGLIVPAQVGQYDFRCAAEAQGRRQPVITGAVVRRAVNEDQDAVGGRVVDPVGEFLAVARLVTPQAWQRDFRRRRSQ